MNKFNRAALNYFRKPANLEKLKTDLAAVLNARYKAADVYISQYFLLHVNIFLAAKEKDFRLSKAASIADGCGPNTIKEIIDGKNDGQAEDIPNVLVVVRCMNGEFIKYFLQHAADDAASGTLQYRDSEVALQTRAIQIDDTMPASNRTVFAANPRMVLNDLDSTKKLAVVNEDTGEFIPLSQGGNKAGKRITPAKSVWNKTGRDQTRRLREDTASCRGYSCLDGGDPITAWSSKNAADARTKGGNTYPIYTACENKLSRDSHGMNFGGDVCMKDIMDQQRADADAKLASWKYPTVGFQMRDDPVGEINRDALYKDMRNINAGGVNRMNKDDVFSIMRSATNPNGRGPRCIAEGLNIDAQSQCGGNRYSAAFPCKTRGPLLTDLPVNPVSYNASKKCEEKRGYGGSQRVDDTRYAASWSNDKTKKEGFDSGVTKYAGPNAAGLKNRGESAKCGTALMTPPSRVNPAEPNRGYSFADPVKNLYSFTRDRDAADLDVVNTYEAAAPYYTNARVNGNVYPSKDNLANYRSAANSNIDGRDQYLSRVPDMRTPGSAYDMGNGGSVPNIAYVEAEDPHMPTGEATEYARNALFSGIYRYGLNKNIDDAANADGLPFIAGSNNKFFSPSDYVVDFADGKQMAKLTKRRIFRTAYDGGQFGKDYYLQGLDGAANGGGCYAKGAGQYRGPGVEDWKTIKSDYELYNAVFNGEMINDQTPFFERALYHRHYDRNVDEAVGGFEMDNLMYRFDMSAIKCRVAEAEKKRWRI